MKESHFLFTGFCGAGILLSCTDSFSIWLMLFALTLIVFGGIGYCKTANKKETQAQKEMLEIVDGGALSNSVEYDSPFTHKKLYRNCIILITGYYTD